MAAQVELRIDRLSSGNLEVLAQHWSAGKGPQTPDLAWASLPRPSSPLSAEAMQRPAKPEALDGGPGLAQLAVALTEVYCQRLERVLSGTLRPILTRELSSGRPRQSGTSGAFWSEAIRDVMHAVSDPLERAAPAQHRQRQDCSGQGTGFGEPMRTAVAGVIERVLLAAAGQVDTWAAAGPPRSGSNAVMGVHLERLCALANSSQVAAVELQRHPGFGTASAAWLSACRRCCQGLATLVLIDLEGLLASVRSPPWYCTGPEGAGVLPGVEVTLDDYLFSSTDGFRVFLLPPVFETARQLVVRGSLVRYCKSLLLSPRPPEPGLAEALHRDMVLWAAILGPDLAPEATKLLQDISVLLLAPDPPAFIEAFRPVSWVPAGLACLLELARQQSPTGIRSLAVRTQGADAFVQVPGLRVWRLLG